MEFAMKKRLLIAAVLLLWTAPAIAAVTAFKDAKGNIYVDGLKKDEMLSIYYYNAAGRYRSVWMYPKGTCNVHRLWHRSAKLSLFGTVTIKGTATGDISFSPGNLSRAAINANPCNGSTINTALPWKVISGSIKAVRLDDTKFNKWADTDTIYIAGLPPQAYQVTDKQERNERFVKVNRCGFVKLANTAKWLANAGDRFDVMGRESRVTYGNFRRSALGVRAEGQIPLCLGGVRYLPK